MIPSTLLVLALTLAANGAVFERGAIPSSAPLSASIPPTSPCVACSTAPPSSTPLSPSCIIPTSTVTSTTPSPTGTGTGTANCNNIQKWQAAFAYTAGNQVIFNNQLYTALQWTYNNAPPAHPDQWAFGGTCAQPINNKVDCTGVSAWQSTVAYTTGNKVTFNGHLWSAVQWTQSNSPGDTSGTWQDLGACK